MTEPNEVTVRRATESDWETIFTLDAFAFGFWSEAAAKDSVRTKVRTDDVVIGEANGQPVAVAMFYRMEVTLPGGAVVPMAGVSWVSVAATHRRRGMLRVIFSALHEHIEAEGFLVSGLTASEATIYERFGYGPASYSRNLAVQLKDLNFRPSAVPPRAVRQRTLAEVTAELPSLNARWAANTPGAVGRVPADWNRIFADDPFDRNGDSPLFVLVHPDGYATYRISQSPRPRTIKLQDFFAVTEQAEAELWQVLAGLDFERNLTAAIAVDSLLPQLIRDPRVLESTGTQDELWLRINRVVPTLEARTYRRDGQFLLGLTDNFLDPAPVRWYDLEITAGSARCTEVAPPSARQLERPDYAWLRLTHADLGSVLLGGGEVRGLWRAGRIQASSGEAVDRFADALHWGVAPRLGTFF